jgi:transaldolase
MTTQSELKVKIFADGADLDGIRGLRENPIIKGFTTNPTLMRQAGVDNYEVFAHKAIEIVSPRPISLEVFSDEFAEMRTQALKIASWGANVFVKIPITNTKGESSLPLVADLTKNGVKVNVTAVFTNQQIDDTATALAGTAGSNISVFAGRIADAGIDPSPYVSRAVACSAVVGNCEVIWASPREVLNVVQADQLGCHIITVTPDLLKKLVNIGKDLGVYSLDTVKMFYNDASAAGYTI